MKAIIIEDETAAAKNLKAILNEIDPDIEILATLDSIQKSVSWLNSNKQPDVIFMDIHLSDGDSFHIFNLVNITSYIIFTTAYDEYAIQAFKVNSIDYLLKPIDPENVAKAISKLQKMKMATEPDYSALIPNIAKKTSYQNTLLAFYQNRIIPLSTSNIAYFQSENEKVTVFCYSGEVFPIEKTLNTLVSILDPSLFFRANRQFLISRQLIKEVQLWEGGRLLIVPSIEIPEQILISKERVAVFKNWLQDIL